MKKLKIRASIENASILRKFMVLFIVMSILPLCVLYYFYWQTKNYGEILISESDFNLTLIFIVLGILLGYGTMRRILMQVIKLAEENRRVLERLLTVEKMKELGQEENEIAILSNAFAAITGRLEENIRSLESAKKALHTIMSKVANGISNMGNIDTFLQMIVETASEALSGKVSALLLFDEDSQGFCVKTVSGGLETIPEDMSMIHLEEEPVLEEIIQEKSPLVFQDPAKIKSLLKINPLFRAPFVGMPLIFQDQLRGVFIIAGRKGKKEYQQDEIQMFSNIASQVTVALENNRLNSDIERTYFETISALALAVDAKDKYSRGHLDRVSDYSVLIAEKMNLDEQDIQTLRDASRVHDLGKIGVPDEVLGKEGPLSDQEWLVMRKHPEIGESIIRPVQSLSHLCDILRHHHEKLDGTGYPDRLKGHEISLLVRILAIADIYDALTTDRAYRKKMSRQAACQVLRDMSEQLDQTIVETFAQALEEKEEKTDEE